MAEFTPSAETQMLAAAKRLLPELQGVFVGESIPNIMATLVPFLGDALAQATTTDAQAAQMVRAIADDVMRCVGEYRRDRQAAVQP